MNSTLTRKLSLPVIVAVLAVAIPATAAPAPGQDGYHVGEGGGTQQASGAATTQPTTGRFARIEYVTGDVTWRPNADSDWKPAKPYIALKSGSQIWAVGDGKAEIRFEDGAFVRLGRGAVATLDTLFNDTQGGFTRVAITSGSAFMVLKSEKAVYQADLPEVSVVASGPARIRLSAERTSNVLVRSGKAVLQGKPGKLNVRSGDFVSVSASDNAYTLRSSAALDGWDRWNDERDHLVVTGRVYGPSATIIAPAIIFGGGHRHRDDDGDRHH